jgi:hypothetical protein
MIWLLERTGARWARADGLTRRYLLSDLEENNRFLDGFLFYIISNFHILSNGI